MTDASPERLLIISALGLPNECDILYGRAGAHSAVGSTSDPRARGPGFDIRHVHKLMFLLPLI